MNRRGQSCAVSFFFFFFRLLVRRVFPQEGKQTEERTLNKTGSKTRLKQRHLLLLGYRQDCMQYICSGGGLLPGTSPAFWNQSNTSRRKQLHCTDNKTRSAGWSSTKGSAVAIVTVWDVTIKHRLDLREVSIAPLTVATIHSCKKNNPFGSRKSRAVTSCYEVAVYVLPGRWALWLDCLALLLLYPRRCFYRTNLEQEDASHFLQFI